MGSEDGAGWVGEHGEQEEEEKRREAAVGQALQSMK